MTRPGAIEMREVPELRSVDKHEIKLKIKKIGVCGSDIHVFHGKHPFTPYPVVQGHEYSGEVVEVGEDVTRVQLGDKATARPQRVCGNCAPCLRGDYNICNELKVEGFQAPGTAQDYFILPEDRIIRLPDSLTYEQGAMIEPAAVGAHSTARAGSLVGKNILVTGAGPIGNLVAQFAMARGASKVLITDMSEFRLEKAAECGIEFTSNAANEDLGDASKRVFGGGSSMDTAKAIAVEATHEGSSWDYLFYKEQPTDKTLPIVAISTTSGTGSQVTQVSVVTNTTERDKSALYNNLLYPRVSIIDPELMVSVPRFVTATTGFDVLCHAFESLLHPNRGAYVELLAKEAIKIVSENLPKVLQNLEDVDARSAMAWADTIAGLCIANAGVTLPHGMGMAIGGMYPHVAHGQALAIVYPACVEYTWEKAIDQHAFLSRTLNQQMNGEDKEAAQLAPEMIMEFLGKIGLQQKLNEVDVPNAEIESLARQCMVLPDYKNNPKIATYGDMVELGKDSY